MSEEWVRWILSGLVGVIMAVFGAMLRRLFTRQDALERDKANRESVDKRFEALLDEIREQRGDLKGHEAEDRIAHREVLGEIKETNREMKETNRQLSMTNATLSNLVGRFEATNGHQR